MNANIELIETTEELQRELEKRRRDERLMAELLTKATELYKAAYANAIAKDKRKKRKNKSLGYMLQSLFGKYRADGGSIWLMKDLDAAQLLQVIAQCERLIERRTSPEPKQFLL